MVPATGMNIASLKTADAANDAACSHSQRERIVPTFNERFLFDDELEATDDSAFMNRYNLSAEDDMFPMLFKPQGPPPLSATTHSAAPLAPSAAAAATATTSISSTPASAHVSTPLSLPSQLSTFSSALDLAPLSQLPKRSAQSLGHGPMALSPWLHAERINSHQSNPATHRPTSFAGMSPRHIGTSPTASLLMGSNPTAHPASSSLSDFFDNHSTSHLPSSLSAFPPTIPSLSMGPHSTPFHAASPAFAPPAPMMPATSSTAASSTPTAGTASPSVPTSASVSTATPAAASAMSLAQPLPGALDALSSGAPTTSFASTPTAHGPIGAMAAVRPELGEAAAVAAAAATASRMNGRLSRRDDRKKNAHSKMLPGEAVDPTMSRGNVGSMASHGGGGGGASGTHGGPRRSDMDLSAMQLHDLQGEIPQLCRDQFGCRFLQKKLDEGIPSQCDQIFAETFPYFAELMTDPFGNYLCQKLLEYCTDAQRDQIVEAIAGDLVTISLNMHGTRAVQKTIDFISTPAQTQAIIDAFARNVVTLIKDLNGNHVIQKCLNRLPAGDNQFIYDAVAAQCVDVATHRHGCCVLQRCIDHASESQRQQLVNEITMYSLTLVQDPFGNYVVQYVLDLNDPVSTESVTNQFLGHVFQLSTQKFSSNVIEKCIRVAEPPLRHKLVAELVDPSRLELLLRDSFANYVVQTCLDYAEPAQRTHLVECIRPILPSIRNTPYGKRIQSKLQRDGSEPSRHRRSEQSRSSFAPSHHHHHHASRFGSTRFNQADAGHGSGHSSTHTSNSPLSQFHSTSNDHSHSQPIYSASPSASTSSPMMSSTSMPGAPSSRHGRSSHQHHQHHHHSSKRPDGLYYQQHHHASHHLPSHDSSANSTSATPSPTTSAYALAASASAPAEAAGNSSFLHAQDAAAPLYAPLQRMQLSNGIPSYEYHPDEKALSAHAGKGPW